MTALDFEAVTLVRDGRIVLDAVSFAVPDGAFVGVLGPNGAGKTTIMRAALGLLPPRSGRIRVLGQAPAHGNPAIGYMPQTRTMPARARLNGRTFLLSALGASRWGLPLASRADHDAVDAALDSVDGHALADRPIAELSGGERQRLLIAEALMGNPRLIMLDEPLVSLDPGNQRAIVELVARIARQRSIAVLFSAHEVNPILPVADLILYLGAGKAAIGSVDAVVNSRVLSDLYATPVHVARVGGRIFVMAEDCELGHHDHPHHDHDAVRASGRSGAQG